MMLRRIPAVVGFGLLLLGGAGGMGCKTVYVPTAVNAPLLTQKGQVRASLSDHNAQVAYAVSDSIGVLANGFWQSSTSDQKDGAGEEGRGYQLELGAGHFRSIGDLLLLEAYGGLGYGAVEHDNWETVNGTRNHYQFSASALKAFAQPSLGVTGDYFDAAISTRVVVLKPIEIYAENYPEERLRQDQLFGLDQHTWGFVEPAVTLRGGYKWIKLFVQYGYSLKLNQAPLKRDVTFLNVGLHMDLAPRFWL